MNLGENLKKLRKENNLSQEQLAEKLNISRQAISKWESGKTYPDIENLILLRNIFKTTLDELIIGDSLSEDKIHDVKSEQLKKHNKDDIEQDDLSVDLVIGGSIIGTILGTITGNYMWSMLGFVGLGIGFIIEALRKNFNSGIKN
ncbi:MULTISPECIES: helix-turn-helix domain-containing protein [unclassified Romboutsia]|uniref:helix-turn-helix domain-containing protein n=1 Tax=unclassified Romboutsia TaxID=2626894 RepID=UPI000821FD3B|nr:MULTISPECIES: helix-turn-helix transcriptional regulator [unclassified Romboutsia]SCH30822.1 HTH-type transcriptional regulator immR [uncultured Clostridium sp.]